MKNITSVLSEEHQNILKVIEVVLDECNYMEAGKEVNKEFFKKVVGFIKNYADGYHHAKEENILFKAMLDNSDCMHCNPIPVMLHEHEGGRNYVEEMGKALAEGNKEKLIENARGYCYLLENHIGKEDNILYPMAEDSVSDSLKQEVIKQYNAVNLKDYFPQEIKGFIEELATVN
ncbi:MAG: cation-binding protein [Chloroflexia bacterium]|nr:cation-binding protein [Chloroflexia bacterium]